MFVLWRFENFRPQNIVFNPVFVEPRYFPSLRRFFTQNIPILCLLFLQEKDPRNFCFLDPRHFRPVFRTWACSFYFMSVRFTVGLSPRHFGQYHLPLGLFVRLTQLKWNHSMAQLSLSQPIISPYDTWRRKQTKQPIRLLQVCEVTEANKKQ